MTGPDTSQAVRLGPGKLVLIVGASGTGKDTVLRAAQDELVSETRIVFPRRCITRASEPSENHVPLSDSSFEEMSGSGQFALQWRAHGLRYGIERAIDADIAAARIVVCNASRTVIAEARARFTHVMAIEVTASAEIRQSRIAQRGREAGVAVEQRLARQVETTGQIDLQIDNNGSLERSVATLVQALRAL